MTAFTAASLADPPGASVLLPAARWVEAALLGPLATTIAVLAVAAVGAAMLSGRIDLRRGATVIVGCFILFGAHTIASGFTGAASALAGDDASSAIAAVPPPQPSPLNSLPPQHTQPYDPYAGAAVRRE